MKLVWGSMEGPWGCPKELADVCLALLVADTHSVSIAEGLAEGSLSELLESMNQSHNKLSTLCARHCLGTCHKPEPP